MRPEILLNNGLYLNFEMLDVAVITPEVIAKSLSKMCRFTGHCSRFYSVAEHSVRASYIDPTRETLMHDAAEAFIADIATPLKRRLPDYQAVDNWLERVIAGYFGLTYPWPEATHRADQIMLATEARDLLPPHEPWSDVDPLAERIPTTIAGDPFLIWELAFMDRFKELFA